MNPKIMICSVNLPKSSKDGVVPVFFFAMKPKTKKMMKNKIINISHHPPFYKYYCLFILS